MQTATSTTAAAITGRLALLGMTKRDLAARLSVSTYWVSRRLNGHTAISIEDLERIATALDTDPYSLLTLPAAVQAA